MPRKTKLELEAENDFQRAKIKRLEDRIRELSPKLEKGGARIDIHGVNGIEVWVDEDGDVHISQGSDGFYLLPSEIAAFRRFFDDQILPLAEEE